MVSVWVSMWNGISREEINLEKLFLQKWVDSPVMTETTESLGWLGTGIKGNDESSIED